MKALIVTLLPLFIRFFFFGCFDLAAAFAPWQPFSSSLSPFSRQQQFKLF